MAMNSATHIVSKAPGATKLQADICVVGSGAAGSMAALTAARLGLKTVLVEAMPNVGGQLVGTLLGTICGLYDNGPQPRRLTFGPVDDLLKDLWQRNAIHARRALNTLVLQYDEALTGRWTERALREAGVELVLGGVVRNAFMVDRRVTTLDVATRWGDLEISAHGFIDASGDSTVAWHAGLPVREPDEAQWGTQMFIIEGFDVDKADLIDGFKVEEALQRRSSEFGLPRRDGFIFKYPGRDIATVNMTHVPNPTEPIAAADAALAGKDQADVLMEFFKSEFPEVMANARIRSYGQPGIRQTRWYVADHHLTLDEVRSGRRPKDAVARCTWPVEAHNSAERVHWEEFKDPGHMHYVPLSSMIHRDADNLVAAGRCIDGDTAALASVRVMGPCFAMGQAAAHALKLAGAGSVRDVSFAELECALSANLENFAVDPWTESAI